jgi:hypothetical protein
MTLQERIDYLATTSAKILAQLNELMMMQQQIQKARMLLGARRATASDARTAHRLRVGVARHQLLGKDRADKSTGK